MVLAVAVMAAAVMCVLGVVCFTVALVAAAVISVLTCVVVCSAEDIAGTAVVFTAGVTVAVAWVVARPAAVVLSSGGVDATVGDFWVVTCAVAAPACAAVPWPGAAVTRGSPVPCPDGLRLMVLLK